MRFITDNRQQKLNAVSFEEQDRGNVLFLKIDGHLFYR